MMLASILESQGQLQEGRLQGGILVRGQNELQKFIWLFP